jgi:hypothetical protein
MTGRMLCILGLWLVAVSAKAGPWECVEGQIEGVGGRPGAVRLQTAEAREVWAASPPLDDVVKGTPVQLSLLVRKVAGAGKLALAFSERAAVPGRPLLWVAPAIQDGGWHRVALVVVCGLTKPRLLCGVVGGAGAWEADEVRVTRAVVPETKVRPLWPAPTYSPPLTGGEDLQGDLDLQRRTIMGVPSYTLRVGALELNPVRELTLRRGERTGVKLDVLGLGNAPKTLGLVIKGGPGWRTEQWQVSVPGNVRMGLSLPLQGMTPGTSDLLVEYTSDGQTRRTPLRVTTVRYYPVLGDWWETDPTAEELRAVRGLPVQCHEVPADRAERWLTVDQPADVILRGWRPSAEAVRALKNLGDEARRRVGGVILGDVGSEEAASGTAEFRSAFPDALLVTPLVAARATDDGLAVGDGAQMAVDIARRGLADAVGLELPGLPQAAVLREAVDGRAGADGMASWQHYDTAMDPARVRQTLSASGAEVPIYWRLRAGGGTGVDGLDTLLLARAVVEAFSWGASGLCMEAKRLTAPDGRTTALGEAYGELLRELAGVRAIAAPEATSIAGSVAGKAVTFRPFLRGDEGIVALWNNTATMQRVAVEIRCRPTQVRLLRFSYPGPAWQREFVGDFDWDPLAKHYKQAAVYVDLGPLQVVVVSLKMLGTHAQWLREVGPRPPAPPVVDPMSREEFDKALWGPK